MRKDGKKAKNVDLLYGVVPYIMNKRHDAMNMITLNIPVEPLKQYIVEKRKEDVRVSHLEIVIASYLRTVAHYPLLNRFIVNKKIYDRKGFYVSMVVLRGEDDSTTSKVQLDLNDNIFEVSKKMNAYIQKNRDTKSTNNTDKMAKFLLGFPGLLSFGVNFCKFLDRYGLLPGKIIDLSPFHTSLFISNLTSIRTNHIYHHCYDFGTTSIFITMGNMREVPVRSKDNEIKHRTCLPLGIVMDERICDGKYFANAFATWKKYLDNPALLEKTFEEEQALKDEK